MKKSKNLNYYNISGEIIIKEQLSLMERAIDQGTRPRNKYRDLAKDYERCGDYNSAIRVITKLINKPCDKLSHDDWLYKVKLYEEMGQYTDALDQLLACIQYVINMKERVNKSGSLGYMVTYKSIFRDDYLYCARICLKMSRENDAIMYFEKAASYGYDAKHDISNVRLRIRAKQLVDQIYNKCSADAIADCTEAIRIDPSYTDAYETRALYRAQISDYHGAIADCNYVLNLNPKHENALYTRSLARRGLGQFTEALQDCNTAITLAPEDAAKYINRASIFSELHRYSEALEDCSKAINLKPHELSNYILRADTYLKTGNYQRAIQDSDIALGLNPQSGNAYAKRGVAKEKLNNLTGALEDYQKAVALGASSVEADLNRLMSVQAERENNERQQADEARRRAEAMEQARMEAERNAKVSQQQQGTQSEYLRAIANLKQECSKPGQKQASKINAEFKRLEAQAFQAEHTDFYLMRGRFYEDSAQAEPIATRKKVLHESAVKSYYQALEFDPFAEGAAERIEALESVQHSAFAVTPQTLIPQANPSSTSPSVLSTSQREKVDVYKQQLLAGQNTKPARESRLDLNEQLIKAFKDNAAENIIQGLIASGADIGKVDPTGEMSLLYACGSNGCYKLAKTLLEEGTNPDTREPTGQNRTVLMLAIINQHKALIELLLQYGANPLLKDKAGRDAMWWIQELGNRDFIHEFCARLTSYNQPKVDFNRQLLDACIHNKDAEMVLKCLDAEADPNVTTAHGDTALIHAVKNGNYEVAELLLMAGASPNLIRINTEGALLVAAKARRWDLVKLLASYRADPNETDANGVTALQLACGEKADYSAAEILLKAGANPDIQEASGHKNTALMLAVTCNQLAIVKLLLSYKANPNLKNADGRDAFWLGRNDQKIIDVLDSVSGNKQAKVSSKTSHVSTSDSQHSTIAFDRGPSVDKLIDNATATLKTVNLDEVNNQLLDVCIENGGAKKVIELLAAGADANVKTVHGDSALIWAVINGNYEIAAALLKAGGNPHCKSKQNVTPLSAAANAKRWDIVKLLATYNVEPNDNTALLLACGKDGNIEAAKVLLRIGANPNVKNKEGWSPLTLAINWNNWDIVRLLASNQANLDEIDPQGNLPLIACIMAGDYATVETLLRAGANLKVKDKEGWSPLTIAANEMHWDMVRLITSFKPNLNELSPYGDTALILACENKNYATIETLLKAGANPNIKNKDGYSPLAIASSNGHWDIIELLAKYKANLDEVFPNGDNALLVCSAEGRYETVEVLLKAGANPNVQQTSGQKNTALILAITGEHIPNVRLLLSYQANPSLKDSEGRDAFWWSKAIGNQEIITALNQVSSKFSLKATSVSSPTITTSNVAQKPLLPTTRIIPFKKLPVASESSQVLVSAKPTLSPHVEAPQPMKTGKLEEKAEQKTITNSGSAQKPLLSARSTLFSKSLIASETSQPLSSAKPVLKSCVKESQPTETNALAQKPVTNRIAELRKRFEAG